MAPARPRRSRSRRGAVTDRATGRCARQLCFFSWTMVYAPSAPLPRAKDERKSSTKLLDIHRALSSFSHRAVGVGRQHAGR